LDVSDFVWEMLLAAIVLPDVFELFELVFLELQNCRGLTRVQARSVIALMPEFIKADYFWLIHQSFQFISSARLQLLIHQLHLDLLENRLLAVHLRNLWAGLLLLNLE